jgi:hypothetical protein
MRAKIETAAVLGEGDARKRYEAGSVVEVTAEQFELNQSWMKASDDPLFEAPAPKEKKADGDK